MNPSFNRICLERFSGISQSQIAPSTFTTSHQKKLLKPFLRQSFLQNKAAIKKSEPQVDHFSNFTIFFYSSEKIKAKKSQDVELFMSDFFSMLWRHTFLKFNLTELHVSPLSINIIKSIGCVGCIVISTPVSWLRGPGFDSFCFPIF